MDYQEFIASKRKAIPSLGFDVKERELNPRLMDWQARVVKWALRRGRSALFEDCGLGKTFQQLEWARLVHKKTKLPVVVHCPVGVRSQTKSEAEKFGVKCSVAVVDDPSEIIDGINLVNYEKLHKFDGIRFGGVVLDESSILKGMNSKTRELLTDRYASVEYRLACTATPSPNDTMELGNHAEFLGVCQAGDMLNRFFYHDSSDTSNWVLMPHGKKDFWSWVSQWAVCIGKPSDIGGSDDGFVLPELRVHRHIVESVDLPCEGALFSTRGITATSIHEEKRITCATRAAKACELVDADDSQCIVWCDTDYESNELTKLIGESVEVKGSMTSQQKIEAFDAFSGGKVKTIITKPSIAGMGLNWQHCNRMVFAGLSYSFEQYYQAVRRCWRFGQVNPVDVHIVIADSESAITSAIARKESDFDAMRCGMAEAMRDSTLAEFGLREGKRDYKPEGSFSLPSFLKG